MRPWAKWLLVVLPLLADGCRWNSRAWPACGNGRADWSEECDGTDLMGRTCTSVFGPGVVGALACGSDCMLDATGCSACADCGPVCGDGVAEPGEECDGGDLGGQDCESLGGGWTGGTLTCLSSCQLDTSDCAPAAVCGNGVREAGEACDGADLGAETCTTIGPCLGPGTLGCAADCTFDKSGCEAPPQGPATERDLNGDGYSDFAVGAPYANGGAIGSGRVYVYFGCPEAWLDATPVAVLDGSSTDGLFGDAIAIPGDLDGDAYDDLVVGAHQEDAAGLNSGALYVYAGGPGAWFDPAPDLLIPGPGSGEHFGSAVAGAGDLNGDGYADLVVGAQFGSGFGDAFVYFGGPGGPLDATADGVLSEGTSSYDNYGSAVSGGGDLDGDGYDELVVGADQESVAAFNCGRAYVYRGGSGSALETTADWTIEGFGDNDALGSSVAPAGDFDGDAFGDLLVGAYAANSAYGGEVYLFRGGPGVFDAGVDATFTGSVIVEMALFGASVHGPGDVNGDGYSDVLVGAYFGNPFGGVGGQAYVFLGGPGPVLDVAPDATLFRPVSSAEDRFGYEVAGAGDVNGDGFPDVLVGAPGSSAVMPPLGEAYLFFGGLGPTFDSTADLIMIGAGGSFGHAISR